MAKVEMDELVLYKSGLGDNVYIGRPSKKDLRVVTQKKDVTSDFLYVAIERWQGHKELIEGSSGKKFIISCQVVTDEEAEKFIVEAMNKTSVALEATKGGQTNEPTASGTNH